MNSLQPEPERWTPDEVTTRDLTGFPAARRRAVETLSRFVDEARAAGFEELGVVGSRFESELECAPEISNGDLRALEAAVAGGIDGAEDKLVWAKQMRGLHELWANELIGWVWAHPVTRDVALFEHTDAGDWVSFRRLHEDGSLARTVRRPDDMPRGAPAATGTFVDAPLPGLYALMCRLGGDHFLIGKGPKPRIRQWDLTVEVATFAEAWAAHRAHADALGLTSPAVPPTVPLLVALDRRTLHVTFAGLERANHQGTLAWRVFAGCGALGVLAVLGLTTGSPLHALAGLVLLSFAAGRAWTVSTGCSASTGLLAPTAITLLWAWFAGVTIGPLSAAFACALAGVVTSRLAFFWLVQAGRLRFDADLAEPPVVSAADLPIVYRD